MAQAAEARAWIKVALGYDIPSEAEAAPRADPAALLRRWQQARDGWRTASDQVGSQLDKLAGVLRADGHPDLRSIADSGLMTVTAGYRTKMMVALMEIGDDPARLRSMAGKAASFAAKLKAQIEEDPRVVACDEATFGVPVSIRATLGGALDELASVLHDAAG